jgi:GH15 family glucan-1,4-alpha-glucosidase
MKFHADPRKFGAVRSGNGVEAGHHLSGEVYVRVAELAYTLYEQRGREDGHDVEDWIQAEQTVLASGNHNATGTVDKSAKAVKSKKATNAKTK